MSRPRLDPTRLISRGLCLGALLGVVTLTLIDRGSTRAYATPWIYLFWFAHAAPLLALALRALPSTAPLNLPSRPWCLLAATFATCVMLSALLSPFPGPSLLAALTPIAGLAAFFLIHDAAHQNGEHLTEVILRSIGLIALSILSVSLIRWTASLIASDAYQNISALLQRRNDFPLGHSNYTAGLALLITPWFGLLAWRTWGLSRAGWVLATILSLAMLFSSGSRGGVVGLAALAVLAVTSARLNRRTLILLTLLGVVVTLAIGYAHPRTRALMFSRHVVSTDSNLSDVQRSAMALGGWRMGTDRPLLGWGPGLTPQVYPRYRSGLDGGVETALQLHSTPVQLWADLGIGGIACALWLLGLVGREYWAGRKTRRLLPRTPSNADQMRRDAQGFTRPGETSRVAEGPANRAIPHPLHTTAIVALATYTVFALTDFQLDVPIFTVAVAACAALIARTDATRTPRGVQLGIGFAAVVILVLVATFGHRDRTAELNVRALTIGADDAKADEAISLLRESLELNPHQEIAHFNLGWLLLVRDPVAAEQHFIAAANLVPDKGGVYFGIALSRLNQDQPANNAAVVRALALECLNDPQFLISPWWNQPQLAGLREATVTELRSLASAIALRLAARNDRRSRDADYVAALGDWLDGRGQLAEILARSHTSGRVSYFAARPRVPEWRTAPIKVDRRERTAYPISMRDMDLPAAVDLYDVQENTLATGELGTLFPPKGWLPEPLLIELLEEGERS